jgi:hypothetical protein
MNNITQFLTKQNIKILWDVLLDELRIETNNKQIVSNIRTVFESNITPFTSRAQQNISLVDLNKQFLSQVVIAVNRLFPGLKQEQELKRINISSEEIQIHEPYKIEDILTARQTNFEKQVKQKQIEFENSINFKRPQELDFSEKVDDGKIKEMDALIAETIARRKFEVEQYKPVLNTNTNINTNTNTNTNILEAEQNSEQIQTHIKQLNNVESDIYQKLKYINIDNNTNNITLNESTNKKNMNTQLKKKVSWTENKLTNNIDLSNEKQENLTPLLNSNIFNKIKKIQYSSDIGNEFKLTKPILAPIVSNNDLNEQVIEFNELNKKYNVLSNKIDTLIDLVTKLTNQFNSKK